MPRQVYPHFCQLQLCDSDNFLSCVFLLCGIQFTLQGAGRTEDQESNSASAGPAGNSHSPRIKYYHHYLHHRCYVNLGTHLWLTHQDVEIISFILDKQCHRLASRTPGGKGQTLSPYRPRGAASSPSQLLLEPRGFPWAGFSVGSLLSPRQPPGPCQTPARTTRRQTGHGSQVLVPFSSQHSGRN